MNALRLLVVEDHRDLAANISDYLGTAGHAVKLTYDGAAGLKVALSEEFDALVLDLMLPRMGGLEICQRLRSAGKQVPVLMLTALDSVPDKVRGFETGADDYLVKPFALAELKVRLEALARRGGGNPGTGLQVADLRYDTVGLHATRGGVAIALNPSTRKILELLMRQTHRVVTRPELKQALWGEAPPDDEVLRAHMHALRQAVDKPFEKHLLRTVHGVGYRLADPDEP